MTTAPTLETLAKEASRLRVPMGHTTRDEEYLEVLAYRVAQEIHASEFRLANLRELAKRIERIETRDDALGSRSVASETST
jgi:hypothetical protein